MIKQGEELAKLLADDETYVFICGLKEMEKGVEEAFEKICSSHHMKWSDTRSAMRLTGRYHVETY